jgi:hypothetical protein
MIFVISQEISDRQQSATHTRTTAVSILLLVRAMFSAWATARTPARFDLVVADPGSSATAAGQLVFALAPLPNPMQAAFSTRPILW